MPYELAGTVTDGGSPVEGAEIIIVRQSTDAVVGTGTTDAAGEWTVDGLENALHDAYVRVADRTAAARTALTPTETIEPEVVEPAFIASAAVVYEPEFVAGVDPGSPVSVQPEFVASEAQVFAPEVVEGSSGPTPMASLSDDFEDGTIGAIWTTTPNGGTIVEQTGQLEITPPAANAYTIFQSTGTYDLTDSQVYARMDLSGWDFDAKAEVWLSVQTSDTNRIRIGTSNTNLYFQRRINGTNTTMLTTAHSATDHAWWRIREESGTVYLDTAPDSAGSPGTWVNRGSFSSSAFSAGLTALELNIQAGQYDTTVSTGTVAIPAVNTDA